jgi:enediyne biosynthesis protein E5
MSSVSDVGSAQIGISAPVAEALKPKVRKTTQAPTVAEQWYSVTRLGGLSRFAFAITVLNIAGHLFLGFEQSWITPFVALAAAYGTELLGESVDAAAHGRAPRFRGSVVDCVKFLLSAHITGLAVGMLLYACEQLWAIAFAASLAIASKYVFRAVVGHTAEGRPQYRHFLNPSNFGIAATLVLFPTVGIAPPYQFTENTWGIVDWLLPLVVICTGSYLNTKATGRIPLILAWVAAFAVQAVLRGLIHDTPFAAGLLPMTGFAFILFTFYMITDPATSPARTASQIVFGCAVAALYAVFMELHIVFGLFYALAVATLVRGLYLLLAQWMRSHGRSLPQFHILKLNRA